LASSFTRISQPWEDPQHATKRKPWGPYGHLGDGRNLQFTDELPLAPRASLLSRMSRQDMIIGAQERGTPAAVAAERHDVHTDAKAIDPRS
jgi:hypothetical protein